METLDHEYGVRTADFSPDGTLLVTGAQDGSLRLWDTNTWELLYTIPAAHVGNVKKVLFSPAQDMIASSGDDGFVYIWKVDR